MYISERHPMVSMSESCVLKFRRRWLSSDVGDVDVVSCSRNLQGIVCIDNGCISGDIGVGDVTIRREVLLHTERRLNHVLFCMAESPP